MSSCGSERTNPHRIGEHHLAHARQPYLPHRRVQGGEQLIRHVGGRTGAERRRAVSLTRLV